MNSTGESSSTEMTKNTGSPQAGEPVFLVVGRLRRPHGIHGEISMEVLTDFPERLRVRRTVFLGEEHQPVRIGARRWQHKFLLLKFDGYETPEQVGELRNQLVFVPAHSSPALPEGDYYHHQLLGMQVVDEGGNTLGLLSEIIETGAKDVYVVIDANGGQTLFPAIEEVILEINPDQNQMRIRPQTWE